MKITFEDKEQLITNPNIPRKNKVVADDVNEIKRAINDNDDSITELDTIKADKSEIPTNLNQLSNADTKFVNETQMANAVQQETTARQQQDVALQSQIDAITSQSDVVDVVGTYAELLNYDTSTITENDIIKVLQDSTHENATSYFRWANNSWDYVGSEGPYYTKGETDERLNLKANQTSLDTTNQNLNTLAGRVGTNETDISGMKAEQTTQNRQIATLITDSGNKIELSVNSQTYILTAILKNKAGEILNSSQVDLPLEAMIVNAEYDSTTKELVLTLQNGTTLRVSLADIVSGLVSQDDFDDLEVRVDNLEDDVADIKDEQDTQNAEIEELQEQVEILENTVNSELEDGTATGESISVTDSADAPAKLLPSGNTYQATSILPEGYTQLDYIESTGTQYIDTGYIPVENDCISMKKVSINGSGTLFSAGNSDNQLILIIETTPGSTYYKYFSTGQAERFLTDEANNIDIVIENGNLYYNNELKATSNYNGTVDTNLFLFKRANDTNYISAVIGRTIIYNNSSVIRDFIPAKNSSNVVGLYDLVTQTFFTNQGTGDFVAGAETTIPNPEYPQDIHVVKGHNELGIKADLFVTANNFQNGKSYRTGTDIIENDTHCTVCLDYLPIIAGNQYDMKTQNGIRWLRLNFYDKNKTFLRSIYYDNEGQYSFTPREDEAYIRFSMRTQDFDTLQILYITRTLELDLPEGMEMCGISDYADTFEKIDGKWYETTRIRKYTFTGQETLKRYGTYGYELTDVINGYNTDNNVTPRGYSNISLLKTRISLYNNIEEGISYNNKSIFVNYGDKTLSEYRQLLTGNVLYYFLISEEKIEITDQTLISQLDAMQKVLSYYAGTNITTISAEDLNPMLTLDYKKSNRLRIENIEQRLNEISQ